MSHLFQFESDFADTLRCIPMAVRYKLDNCGVKLKLQHWNHFTPEERRVLLEAPCTNPNEISCYRLQLHHLVQSHTGEIPSDLPLDSQPDWANASTIPESVQAQSQTVGASITLQQWESLTPLQRFVLIKLSRSNHENKNFLPALREFHLV
jgi:hypothetical protein